MAAILLFCIVQKYYLNKSCIFFQVLLPHIISEPKKVTGTIGALTLEHNGLPILLLLLLLLLLLCKKLQGMALECLPVALCSFQIS
jgi:hypothetical protein